MDNGFRHIELSYCDTRFIVELNIRWSQTHLRS